MSSEDEETKYINAAVAALKDSAIPPAEAAATIAASCASHAQSSAARSESTSYEGDTPGLEGFGWGFFGKVIDLASEDPSTHQRISNVLRELEAIGRRGCDGWKLWNSNFDWANLPLFGPSAREGLYLFVQEQPSGEVLPTDTEEAWRLLSTDAIPNPNDTKAVAYAHCRKRWVNMYRFFMRVWADGVSDFSNYAIYALRDGLEDLDLNQPDTPGSGQEPRALAIETAAAVVEEVVETLYKCRKIMGPKGRDDWPENSGAPGRGGKRWTGVDGYHPERWALWKTVLGEVAENGGQYKVPDHVVGAAKRAIAAMERVETTKQ